MGYNSEGGREGLHSDRIPFPNLPTTLLIEQRFKQGVDMRYTWLRLPLALSLGMTMELHAQVRSPIQDLLGTARTALNDLRYGDAEAITQAVLEIPNLRRSDRIQALHLAAGALFPEQETAQKRDRALERLRQLIRIAPSAALPTEVSWDGLEALFREARLTTFGASASPRDRYVLTGPDDQAEIEIATSRPAQVTMWLEPVSGAPSIALDSISVTSRGTLRFRILAGSQPRLASGAYRLVLRAMDDLQPDTIRFVFPTSIQAPPIQYVDVPPPLDTTSFLPELTRPRRVGGIAGGIALLATTITASRLLRDTELKAAAGVDGRAIGLGIVLGLGAAGGVWALDRGVPIPENIARNQSTRADHAKRVAEAGAANAELLRTYKAEITITLEDRS